MTVFTKLCKDLEHFKTPEWAIEAIMRKEALPGLVLDPCTGTGVMAQAARSAGLPVVSMDIHDWGYAGTVKQDFLNLSDEWTQRLKDQDQLTVFMNPPFSKAVDFVRQAVALGAQKIVCFQRQAWVECEDRRPFWDELPNHREYVCGNRAICWRADIQKGKDGKYYDPETGKRLHGAATAHAWFVWSFDEGPATQTIRHRLYKEELPA